MHLVINSAKQVVILSRLLCLSARLLKTLQVDFCETFGRNKLLLQETIASFSF